MTPLFSLPELHLRPITSMILQLPCCEKPAGSPVLDREARSLGDPRIFASVVGPLEFIAEVQCARPTHAAFAKVIVTQPERLTDTHQPLEMSGLVLGVAVEIRRVYGQLGEGSPLTECMFLEPTGVGIVPVDRMVHQFMVQVGQKLTELVQLLLCQFSPQPPLLILFGDSQTSAQGYQDLRHHSPRCVVGTT
jgi:hypothetical protein